MLAGHRDTPSGSAVAPSPPLTSEDCSGTLSWQDGGRYAVPVSYTEGERRVADLVRSGSMKQIKMVLGL